MIASALAQADSPFLSGQWQTSDVDEHAACLREWEQCYVQLSEGSFRGVFEEFCFGNVHLFREHFNQIAHESGSPWRGSRSIGVATAVDGQGWFRGKAFDLDSIVDMQGGDELDFRTPRQHEVVIAVVDAQALIDYSLRVDHRDPPARTSPDDLIVTAPLQAARLRGVLTSVFASLRAAPQLLVREPMRRTLEQTLFGSVLEAIHGPHEHRPPSSKTRQRIVERARDFMREHIDEPISVEDLCVHLRVSRRTLQYSFQDVLDLNPVRFLRALRLNGARRTLKEADPKHDTVTDIAARWGFWHLSHFATDYRSMFGEQPSDTLRRPPADYRPAPTDPVL